MENGVKANDGINPNPDLPKYTCKKSRAGEKCACPPDEVDLHVSPLDETLKKE
jgi:hypothetical protein